MDMVTGTVLRKERRDAEVTATELARRMGITRQSVHRMEKPDARPRPERVEQYRAALRQESKG